MSVQTASTPGHDDVPFRAGDLVAGKYRVERLLGTGGMGFVVLATHVQLEQRVALKFLWESLAASSPEAVERFVREARAAARIRSEHVVRVSDVGALDDGRPYIVMEYLQGNDLDDVVRMHGRVPLATCIDYALQACEALAEAHAVGIVHRDLKPANLFLARGSDGSVCVKLLDFGISKVAVAPGEIDHGITRTQALMGSPLYMAPEQMRSTKNVDHRADIWSMGVILYEMLAGAPPFDGATLPEICAQIMCDPPRPLRELRPDLPIAFDGVLTRALAKDVGSRFQNVGELALALASFGSPESRRSVERVMRLSARQAIATAPTVAFGGYVATPAPTAAAFGKSDVAITQPLKTRAAAAVAIAAGAIVVAASIAIVAIVAATRNDTPRSATASSIATAAFAMPPATSSTAIASPEPVATASPASATPGASAPAATTRAQAPPVATARPPPAPHGSATASPAGTNAFGGRE